MANNQGGAIIPYQPTYSIQYKYGDRYGGQNFANPTTAINTGQAGGPLSAQSTLDGEDATQTIVNPTTTASGGNGEALDSEASGAPGGTGGADFSQFRNQYTPTQPDFGWQYAHNYGNDSFTDPSLTGLFNTPEATPVIQGFNSSQQDGGDDSFTSNPNSKELGLETDLAGQKEVTYGNSGFYGPSIDLMGDITEINSNNPGIGTETGAGAVGSGGAGIGMDLGDSYGYTDDEPDTEGVGEAGPTGMGDASDVGIMSEGGLVPPTNMGKRDRNIPPLNSVPRMVSPNPIFQDPLADYFRRA